MSSAGCRHGAVEDRGRCSTTDAVAMVWTLEVVELHEPVKATVERRPAGEIVPTKDHAPMLGKNRLLQPFDEAVGPGMARLDPRVANPEACARGGELGFEFRAPIRQHAPQRP